MADLKTTLIREFEHFIEAQLSEDQLDGISTAKVEFPYIRWLDFKEQMQEYCYEVDE